MINSADNNHNIKKLQNENSTKMKTLVFVLNNRLWLFSSSGIAATIMNEGSLGHTAAKVVCVAFLIALFAKRNS
jgi:hypothetical protein